MSMKEKMKKVIVGGLAAAVKAMTSACGSTEGPKILAPMPKPCAKYGVISITRGHGSKYLECKGPNGEVLEYGYEIGPTSGHWEPWTVIPNPYATKKQ